MLENCEFVKFSFCQKYPAYGSYEITLLVADVEDEGTAPPKL